LDEPKLLLTVVFPRENRRCHFHKLLDGLEGIELFRRIIEEKGEDGVSFEGRLAPKMTADDF
jgi:hypothetical protein